MCFEIILNNYRRGLWSRDMVELAVESGLITREQADQIYE